MWRRKTRAWCGWARTVLSERSLTATFALFLRCLHQAPEVRVLRLSCLTRCLLLFNSASLCIISQARQKRARKRNPVTGKDQINVFPSLSHCWRRKECWDVAAAGDASPAPPAGLMLLVWSPDVNLNHSCFTADAPLWNYILNCLFLHNQGDNDHTLGCAAVH